MVETPARGKKTEVIGAVGECAVDGSTRYGMSRVDALPLVFVPISTLGERQWPANSWMAQYE